MNLHANEAKIFRGFFVILTQNFDLKRRRSTEASRSGAVKKIWEYVKSHNLQVAIRIGASFVSLKSSKSWKTRRCPRVFEVCSRCNEALVGEH
ncbi:---NA--- [Olea europaea subsp. europaea]|uniref:---NA n=1 Tax=Olea europaea subsp. europaea TaxID=158383 RepID=A0A8S0Q447_OLEEU|nr:---NA--- [Olea europaea subsp. europaea]